MTPRPASSLSSLKRRIRQFYHLLNQRDFTHCHEMIDPRVLVKPSSVTRYQYENSLSEFMDHFGVVEVREFTMNLHLGEPSELYEGRDFAVGKTTWLDEAGEQHDCSERWVREGRSWYTRSTGFITPAAVMIPLIKSDESAGQRRGKQTRSVKPG
jgi:hypothetical protein